MTRPTIDFRPMTEADLTLVEAWLAHPHTQPWWPPDDIVEIRRAVHGEDAVEPWILVVEGRDVVFGRGPWPAVCAGPDPANTASIRVLEKNGFRFAGVIDTEDGPEHLMVLRRADWEASVERAAQHGE